MGSLWGIVRTLTFTLSKMGATGEVHAEEWQDLTFSKDHSIKGSLVLSMSHGKTSVKTGDANGVAPS